MEAQAPLEVVVFPLHEGGGCDGGAHQECGVGPRLVARKDGRGPAVTVRYRHIARQGGRGPAAIVRYLHIARQGGGGPAASRCLFSWLHSNAHPGATQLN